MDTQPPKPVIDVATPARQAPPGAQHMPVRPAPADDGSVAPPQAAPTPSTPPSAPAQATKAPPPTKATGPAGIVVLTITTMLALSVLAVLAYLKS